MDGRKPLYNLRADGSGVDRLLNRRRLSDVPPVAEGQGKPKKIVCMPSSACFAVLPGPKETVPAKPFEHEHEELSANVARSLMISDPLKVMREEAYQSEKLDDHGASEYMPGRIIMMVWSFCITVRQKIKAGAKLKFADYDQRTPLHLAACEGHAKITEILLQNGADATFKDRFRRTAVVAR